VIVVLLLAMAATPGAAAGAPPLLRGLETRTIILTYHDMVPKRDKAALWFDCTPQEFNDQLDWLVIRGASFISIQQLYEHLTKGSGLPPNPVMVTFADNYMGFYKRALPIIRKRKLPVTMFVHTDFVGSKRGRPKMTWEQLAELDKEGLVTVASQTRSHPKDLTTLSNEKLRYELRGSKDLLEERLGHPVPYLAYPNGKFNSRVATFAAAAGYTMAFTEEQRPAELSPSIFEVARYVHTRYQQAWGDTQR
jgi:peptidoglycan/xylan/chitin deacetylase (PgdA/CDA1 family)